MRRGFLLSALLVTAALGLPPPAAAGGQTLTYTVGPVTVGGYGVVQSVLPAPSPSVDGYVVFMTADDNARPYTRAMGIMLVYFAPGPVAACEPAPPLETDAGAPSAPPPFRMPLPRAPTGKLRTNLRSTWVGDYRYGHERVALSRGTTFSWRFIDRVQHDVTLVNGPVGFSSPWTLNGTFRHRFTRVGTYELFCSLHRPG